MKKTSLFFVSFVATASFFTAGCVHTPKVVQKVPVYVGTNAPATEVSPYKFSQEPVKRAIEDDGPEYSAHVREMQRMRLAHERALAAIEQEAQEKRLAKERGVILPASSLPQAAVPRNPVGRFFRWLDTPSPGHVYYAPSPSYSYGGGNGRVTVKEGTFLGMPYTSTSWSSSWTTPTYSYYPYYEYGGYGRSFSTGYRWP